MKDAYKFWDRMSRRYFRQPIADEEAYRTKLQATQALFRADMDVLEIGCGTGGTAIAHAPFVRHIRAIDFSEAMLEKARAQASARNVSNVRFERADIVEMSDPDDSYDVVLAMSILHLLEDPDAAIAKVFGLLKPGGHFVSSTACIGDTMAFMRMIAPLGQAIGLLPILTFMTSDELISKLERAGFEIVHRWQPGKGKALFLIARKPG